MADTVQVQIFNTALGALGQEPITDLNPPSLDASLAATKLMRHIEVARDTVLRRHGWLCALEYTTLTPVILDGYSNFRYQTTYELPGNALRVWEIEGIGPTSLEGLSWEPRWQVGAFETGDSARTIIRAANAQAQLNVVYVRRAAWSALDAHVSDAIAYTLAARGCFSVTGDMAKQKSVAQEAEAKVVLAISTEASQEGGQPSWAPSIPGYLRNLSR